MEHAFLEIAVDADATAVLVEALESSLYGQGAFSKADLQEEWSELDLEQNARVVRDGNASSATARCASETSSGASRDTSIPTRSGAGSGG